MGGGGGRSGSWMWRRKYSRFVNRDYVVYNLKEAEEAIEQILRDIASTPHYSEVELAIGIAHVYHHLNTAWNAREADPDRVERCSDEDFRQWRKFPEDIEMGA
jgi:hypothetical protein